MPAMASEVDFGQQRCMKRGDTGAPARWLPVVGLLVLVVAASAHGADAPEAGTELQKQIDAGAALYGQRCATCHDHPRERIPPRESLGYRSPEAVFRALTRGVMKDVAGSLDADQARELTAFLTGRMPGSLPKPKPNRCAGDAVPVVARANDWPVIGRDLENTRYAAQPGWRAEETARLALKWVFAYPEGATGPPIAVGGRVFLASGTGEVFSLDAHSGCAWWTYASDRLVRGVSFGTRADGGAAVFFGDHKGFVTALDARTGALLWTSQIEDHVLAKITAPPSVFDGRVYVPVSSIEDPLQHEATYACCTFRGSVVALDAATGRILWKTYTIPEEPKPLARRTPDGPPRYGPAGAAIWNPLTIDRKRGLVYATTGESYDDGNPEGAHAIIAWDLATGEQRWLRQFKPEPEARACREGGGESDCRNLFEFGTPVVLHTLASGKQILLAGQKSGFVYGLDPDADGAPLWRARPAQGGDMGGIMYGLAVDASALYAPISDLELQAPARPGGLVALDAASGETRWRVEGHEPVCSWGAEGCV
ncbi:MAG: hypothetical protein E4H11_03660, partial [Myxococcales bacterium]